VAKRNVKTITEGVVVETLPDTIFKVKLLDGREILAHLSGNMRRFRITILVGDRVRVEISSYDPDRGRIVYRFK